MNERGKALCDLLGIEHPLIQAPMAGLSTPELVAAVSNEGALGSLAAAYLGAEEIRELAARTRKLTAQPFAINLFALVPPRPSADSSPILAALAPMHRELGLPAPALTGSWPDFDAQLETVIELEPRVFSFTLGLPSPAQLERVRRAGIRIVGTAISLAEARALEAAGVDAICAQGAEAGGHRGTFLSREEDALIGTLALVPQLVEAVRIPVIAAGGIMDGRGIAAVSALGASAAQLGTAFIACPECGAAPSYKAALREGTTALTRVFSGKLGRALRNQIVDELDRVPPLPFPLQHFATGAIRKAASRADDPRFLALWAGQGASRARAMPAGELVRTLVAEAAEC
jgi:nitronate monooxygenase